MQKVYSRIEWENYPQTTTPLNETNLNKIDYATDEIDNRVIALDTTKLDIAVANGLVDDITFNSKTGIFTITFLDGSTATIDTLLEKVVINFDYDDNPASPTYQKIIIELEDGTYKYIDLSALITEYEFKDSNTIAFSVDTKGVVSAEVKLGSITDQHLRPNYLADIRVSEANAKQSELNAKQSEINAGISEVNAHGSADRAESEADRAKAISDAMAIITAGVKFWIGTDGHLYYETENYHNSFYIDPTTGHLMYTVV